MEFAEAIKESINNDTFIYGIFTVPVKKLENIYNKITIRPVTIKDNNLIQFEKFTNTKAFHENMDKQNAVNKILDLIKEEYKNINLFTKEADYQIIVSKKGNKKVIENPPSKQMSLDNHNKIKQYTIKENEPCDFLIELGVMNKDGKVLSKKYDKFKQINKFLEIVDDTISGISFNEDFKIIDFGCGKAYLTFALYYYFYKIKNINVNIIGLDLKDDVILFCNQIANKLNYKGLKFQTGDIKDYNDDSKIDMVVTLHACDNATDAALVKAIKWGASIILSVPCCQHEFFDKIDNESMEPMLKHGLIKERLSSLVTESLRGLFLEMKGYKVMLMEFISMEHTPKNILIRAVKTKKQNMKSDNDYNDFKKTWNLDKIFIEEYFNEVD